MLAAIAYQQTQSDTMRPATKKYEEQFLRECHKTVISPGDGQNFPKLGECVKIRYEGWLKGSGLNHPFDSGVSSFPIGVGKVIQGMDAGILTMSLGESARLQIPSAYAYGPRGMYDVIPPNADLTFEVHLIDLG